MIPREEHNRRARWMNWVSELEAAIVDAGYDSQYDMPVYDFVESQTREAEKVDAGISDMFDKGMSPEEAVVELEDRDRFWTTWATPGGNEEEDDV